MNTNHYLERWSRWPLLMARIPDKLNPFVDDKVDITAVLGYHLPYENSKFITVLGLLKGAKKLGMLDGVHTLVESTSGNTGIVLASLARFFNVPNVKLIVNADLPSGKKYPLLMNGAEVITPEEGLSGIATARKQGGGGWKPKGWRSNNGCLNLDQYANPDGAKLHEKYTGERILGAFWREPPTVFVAGIGTGGTMIGVSNCLRQKLEHIDVVGVLLNHGQKIPGVRDLNRMKEVLLPWQESLSAIMKIDAQPSYLASMWLSWVIGLTAGPSSGFAYLGALKFIKGCKESGTLDRLRNKNGRVKVAVMFPDGQRPYGEQYLAHLPHDHLRPESAPWPDVWL